MMNDEGKEIRVQGVDLVVWGCRFRVKRCRV